MCRYQTDRVTGDAVAIVRTEVRIEPDSVRPLLTIRRRRPVHTVLTDIVHIRGEATTRCRQKGYAISFVCRPILGTDDIVAPITVVRVDSSSFIGIR